MLQNIWKYQWFWFLFSFPLGLFVAVTWWYTDIVNIQNLYFHLLIVLGLFCKLVAQLTSELAIFFRQRSEQGRITFKTSKYAFRYFSWTIAKIMKWEQNCKEYNALKKVKTYFSTSALPNMISGRRNIIIHRQMRLAVILKSLFIEWTWLLYPEIPIDPLIIFKFLSFSLLSPHQLLK